jgi:hypothetical protein
LGNGAVRYLGFTPSVEPARLGQTLTVRHAWQVVRPLDRPYRVFVHGLVEGARGWVENGDHDVSPPTDRWDPNTLVITEQKLTVPAVFPGLELELRVGLWDGHSRLPVDGGGDGEGRIRAGSLAVAGDPLPRPTYHARYCQTPPRVDGRIDEGEWCSSAWTRAFLPSLGQGSSPNVTEARLVWDDAHLYLAMRTTDPDITATLFAPDAPLYREEALEIFLDPTSSHQDYVELQTNPLGARFDAAFHGGPRRNMDTAFDAQYHTAVVVDGTLNDPHDHDRAWSTEWRIDLASLPGVELPWVPGACMRINLLHIGKDRTGGALRRDESAWSPPLQGDFHNLERFGDLCFDSAPP